MKDATPSTCRTRSSSTTLFEDAIPDGLPRSARIKLDATAASRTREYEIVTLKQEIERLGAQLEIAVTQHAGAIAASKQQLAVITSQNVTLLHAIEELTTLVRDQGQIISSLTAKVQQQAIEIDTLQSVEQDSDRVIDALIRQDRDLRSARTQAEARAVKAEVRAEQAESAAACAEVKAAASAALINKATATAIEHQYNLAQAEAKVAQFAANAMAAENKVTAINEELDSLHIKLAVLETENAEYSHRIEVLQNDVDNKRQLPDITLAGCLPTDSALLVVEDGLDIAVPEMKQPRHINALQHINLRLFEHAAQLDNGENVRQWLSGADSEPALVERPSVDSIALSLTSDEEDESYRHLLAVRDDVIRRLNPNEALRRNLLSSDEIYSAAPAWSEICHVVEWSPVEDEETDSSSFCCHIVPSPTQFGSSNQADSDMDSVTTPTLAQLELEDDETFFESHKTTNRSKQMFTIPDTPTSHVWVRFMRDWIRKEDVDGDDLDELTPSPTFQPCHAM